MSEWIKKRENNNNIKIEKRMRISQTKSQRIYIQLNFVRDK